MTTADSLYTELVAHYRGCAVCTSERDCAIGHGLLMEWGALESAETSGWWHPDAERRGIRQAFLIPDSERYLPDPGERTAND